MEVYAMEACALRLYSRVNTPYVQPVHMGPISKGAHCHLIPSFLLPTTLTIRPNKCNFSQLLVYCQRDFMKLLKTGTKKVEGLLRAL